MVSIFSGKDMDISSIYDSLLTILKSDLSDKIKRKFYQAAAMPVLLYVCTTWTLTKRFEKKVWWELRKDVTCRLEPGSNSATD